MGGMKARRLILATLALTFVFALYLVGYFVIIERHSIHVYHHTIETHYAPVARIGGRVSEWFYYPIIELDYLVRPSHWESVESPLQ